MVQRPDLRIILIPLPKTNQDRIVEAEKLMSSHPSAPEVCWNGFRDWSVGKKLPAALIGVKVRRLWPPAVDRPFKSATKDE